MPTTKSELLHQLSTSTRDTYLRGYRDAVNGRSVNTRANHRRAYLDGHHDGSEALRAALDTAEQTAYEFVLACEKLID